MEQFGVINYFTYLAGVTLVVLLPGPNSLYVLTLAAQQGKNRGWAAATAVFIGDSILMLLTAAGAVTVLTAYPALFFSVKILGALYLGYLGIRMLYGAWVGWISHKKGNEFPTLKPISARQAFNKALIISLLNPKAILFFLSFFVQFISPNYSTPAIPFLILAGTLLLVSFFYLSALIYAGIKLAGAFRKRRRLSSISGGSIGLGFLGFAIKLALANTS